MTVTPEQMLSLLRDVCEAGDRCPTTPELKAMFGSVPWNATPATLARRGHLVLWVYGKNWRVIELDGMASAPSPLGGDPYLRIDSNGTKRLSQARKIAVERTRAWRLRRLLELGLSP